MRKGATTAGRKLSEPRGIVALRNEKGSYNPSCFCKWRQCIVALRNEKGSYNNGEEWEHLCLIVALRNEKGSYNFSPTNKQDGQIVALRNEKDATLTCNSNLLSFLYIIVFPVYLVLQFLQNAIGRANILRLSA